MRHSVLTPAALLLASLPLAACQTMDGADGAAGPAATGALATVAGAPVGTVSVSETATGLSVRIAATAMTPGTYGAHIHAVGRCEGPAFASAGGHWNPTMRQHGRLNPAGTHSGDLPNLVVGADGTGTLAFTVAGGLAGPGNLLDEDGAALVVHARADDERTDPSGNSGDRIACAVLSPG